MNQDPKTKGKEDAQVGATSSPDVESSFQDLTNASAGVAGAIPFRPERLRAALPELSSWVDSLVAEHLPRSVSVHKMGFPNLSRYFPERVLRDARVCVVDATPVVPLDTFGLPEVHKLFPTAAAGITFKNLYFVQRSFERDESLHAHELVHVVQWDFLGPEKFLMLYGVGLLEHGYRKSPLEAMAYRLQDHFNARGGRIDFASQIRGELQKIEARAATLGLW